MLVVLVLTGTLPINLANNVGCLEVGIPAETMALLLALNIMTSCHGVVEVTVSLQLLLQRALEPSHHNAQCHGHHTITRTH
jgi:hypothetical protein